MTLLDKRVFSRLAQRFDSHYPQLIRAGLLLCVWFSVFARAAHDLWAASFVFGLLTFLVLILLAGHARTERHIQLPFVGPLLLFMAALVMSTAYSYDLVTSRFECWIWLFSFIGFYLLINAASNPTQINSFFEVSSYVLLPLALFCIYEHATGLYEIHATLINSIILSGFVLYWLFFVWHRWTFRSHYSALLAALLVLLLLGRSWSALISVMIGLMYYYKERFKILNNRRLLSYLYYILALLFFGFLVVSIPSSIHNGKFNSIVDRLAWWHVALNMARYHPIVGVGAGAYGTAFPYFLDQRGLQTLHAHSFPLQLLAETGLLGFLSFFWLVASLTRRIRILRFPAGTEPPTRKVFIATLITVTFFSLWNINLEYFLNKLMLLFAFVPLWVGTKTDTNIQSRKAMFIASLIVILLIPSWLAPWRASTYLVEGLRYEEAQAWPIAKACYLKAIALDGSYADAYAGLARTDRETYRQTHGSADLAAWRSDMNRALHWKKDIHSYAELNHPPQ